MITHDKTILDIFLFPSEASGSGVPVTEGWACLGKRGGAHSRKTRVFPCEPNATEQRASLLGARMLLLVVAPVISTSMNDEDVTKPNDKVTNMFLQISIS